MYKISDNSYIVMSEISDKSYIAMREKSWKGNLDGILEKNLT